MSDITVIEVASHRNGVCGEPFHVIRFLWSPSRIRQDVDPAPSRDDAEPENFLAIVHDQPGFCSVIGLDRIEDMGVRFAGGNSWRGDHFESFLRNAIEEHRQAILS